MFRKVADVKREKELEEKRKNDPPLDLSSDHPVRKLISRFRKISDNKLVPPSDVEKGDAKPNNQINGPTTEKAGTAGMRMIKINESNVLNEVSKQQNSAVSKWGKFLAAGTGSGNQSVSATPQKPSVVPPNPLKQDNSNPVASRLPAKPMSKWGKMLGKQHEPIVESNEEDDGKDSQKSNLRKTDSTDSGILHSDKNLDQIGEEGGAEGGLGRTLPQPPAMLTPAEQHVIASLYDIKLEIKEEIENLNLKMTKIDDQISDILKMFTPVSTPFSSHTPSSLSSRLQSCASSTASSSSATSPKSSLPSSPHRTGQDAAPNTSIESSRTVTPPSRKGSAGSSGSSSAGKATRSRANNVVVPLATGTIGPAITEQKPNPSGANNSNNGARKTISPPKKKQPTQSQTVPQVSKGTVRSKTNAAYEHEKDEDNVPFKDRDLDIL